VSEKRDVGDTGSTDVGGGGWQSLAAPSERPREPIRRWWVTGMWAFMSRVPALGTVPAETAPYGLRATGPAAPPAQAPRQHWSRS